MAAVLELPISTYESVVEPNWCPGCGDFGVLRALVDVFSPCVTYNKINTYDYFRKRVYKLEAEDGYDASNVEAALAKSFEWGERIPIGVFYRDEQPTYEDCEPALRNGPLVGQPLGLSKETFDELMGEFL